MPYDLHGLSWERIPGLLEPGAGPLQLEQLEAGLHQMVPKSQISGAGEFGGAFNFLNWLGGLRKTGLTWSEEIYVPICNLYVPLNGKSSLTYERSSKHSIASTLKIYGIGFGGSQKLSFSESIGIPASDTGRSYQAKLVANFTQYVNIQNDNTPEWSMSLKTPSEAGEYRVIDLPSNPLEFSLLNASERIVLKSLDLSSASGKDPCTNEYKLEKTREWEVSLGFHGQKILKVPSIPLNFDLTYKAEHFDQFTIKFELPPGKKYVFYSVKKEMPFGPKCALQT